MFETGEESVIVETEEKSVIASVVGEATKVKDEEKSELMVERRKSQKAGQM